jgi:cyclopropane fatty-acyl-phospholipid synthase-like methyltransferase
VTDGAKSEWAIFFDGHAPEYEENIFTKNTQAEVDFLCELLNLKPDMSVLDVGCGTGRHSIELARRGVSMTGIDLSAGMLDEAKRNAKRAGVDVRLIQCDAKTFSTDDEFDAVICLCEGAFGLLGASDDPIEQPLAILRNVAAAMKDGARCVFTVLSAYRLVRMHGQDAVESGAFDPIALAERSEIANEEMPHIREKGFVPTELTLLFRMAGL